jgi:hypothetical protein
MRKSLSVDAILAALAVVSTTACARKAESTGPAPEATASPPSLTAAPPPREEEPPAAPSVVIDAGKETAPPSASGAKKGMKGPAAACGAGGCSPEMKKGGK